MSVETSTQSLLIEIVSNQTNATTENEQAIENTNPEVVLDLFTGKCTAGPHEINEANSNATIDVQNQVVLLRCCHRLNGNGVIEETGTGEILLCVFLDQLDTKIGVVAGFDSMPNTGDF